MFLLVATVCAGLEASTCETQYYMERLFQTEKECALKAYEDIPKLNLVYSFVNARCIKLPGQTA